MIKIKRFSTSMVILLLIIIAFPNLAYGKLTVLPPEKMLDKAQLVVIGEVISIDHDIEKNDNMEVGEIKVKQIIKGDYTEETIILHEVKYITGAVIERIPPIGSEVFLLLGASGNYFVDGNQIGIIEDGQVVDIYDGINLEIHPYVEKYNEYYQLHKNEGIVIEQTSDTAIISDNPETKSNSTNWNNGYTYLIGATIALVLLGLLIYFFKFKK